MKNTLTTGAFFLVLICLSCAKPDTELPITTSSDEARDLFIQGREKFDNVDFGGAAGLFDQAIAKDSEFALAYVYRAMCGGGTKVLHENLEKAQALGDKITPGERLMINVTEASVHANGPMQKAYLDKLLAMFPDDKRLKMYAGNYYQGVGQYETAIECYAKALEIDTAFAPAYNFLGYANIALGNLEDAEKALKDYVRLAPNLPNPYDSYAELLMKMGRYDESIAQYQKALDIDNAFLSGLSGIGNNYIFKGDFPQARKCFQMRFEKGTLIDEKLDALYSKALSFMYENKPNEAVKAFAERRLFAEKEKQPEYVVLSITYQGFVLAEMGKASDGVKKYDEAIAAIGKVGLPPEEKENYRVYSNSWHAYAYAANNMLDHAKASAQVARSDYQRRNNPDEKAALEWTLAFIDYKGGKFDAAIDRYSKALPNPWAMFYQAQCHLKKGNKEAAKALFTKILNYNQNTIFLAAVWSRTRKAVAR